MITSLRHLLLIGFSLTILLLGSACVRSTTVENVPPGGIPIEHKAVPSVNVH